MKEEEKIVSTAEGIFAKIFDGMLGSLDKAKEREAISKKSAEERNDSYRNYNIGIYSELSQKFEVIRNTNSPINGTIKALQRFSAHLSEQLETRSTSAMAEDREFCQALYNLRNIVNDYRLGLERQFLADGADDVAPEIQKTRRNEVLDYNRTELSQNQLVFLFSQMRTERMFTSNISNVDIARAIEILTGNSEKKIAQKMSKIGEIEFSPTEKEQLRSKLDKVGKALEASRGKK